VRRDIEDEWLWMGVGSQIYTVKSAYHRLMKRVSSVCDDTFKKL